MVFGRKRAKSPLLTRSEVATIIESFLSGDCGPWDWDDFISVPIGDPELDLIRERCAQLDSEFPPNATNEYCGEVGNQVLRRYVEELRR